MSYQRSLQLLRGLVLAQNAVDEAVAQATEDVLDAAAEESMRRGVAAAAVMQQGRPIGEPAATTGVRPKDSALQSSTRKKIVSEDVEAHVRTAWARASTDDARERVRKMMRSAIENGILYAEAGQRLVKLTAA